MPNPYDPYSPRPPGQRLRRDRPSRRGPLIALLLVLVLLAALAGWWLWRTRGAVPALVPTAVPTPPQVTGTIAPPPEPVATGPKYPVEPAAAPGDLRAAIAQLLGNDPFAALVQTADFPRRFVATVDSLGREYSPPRVWPVPATPDRFITEPGPDGTVVISPANAARYAPLVTMAEHLDPQAAADLYRSLYPQLQEAYRNLGFGDRYFNDRLMEVIDLLIASPELPPPVAVRLLQIRGPDADPRPWVHWEFADPQLQAMPAGQKIMVRMGLENERRLKRVLRRLRRALASGGAAGPQR